MNNIYALVNGNVVVNTIVADADFVASIASQYQLVSGPYQTTDQYPCPGYAYDPSTHTFTAPLSAP